MKILTYIPSLPSSRPGIYVHPDSCWLLSNRPLYIPDFAESFVAVPAMAVKSTKLGKAIGLRFTPRYFGEYAPALIILPAEEEVNFRSGTPISALSLCFDNAVVLGDWSPIGPLPEPLPSAQETPELASKLIPSKLIIEISESGVSRENSPETCRVVEKETATDLFPEAFSLISTTNMVKTGDVVMIPSDISIPLTPGMSVSIRMDAAAEPRLLTRFK